MTRVFLSCKNPLNGKLVKKFYDCKFQTKIVEIKKLRGISQQKFELETVGQILLIDIEEYQFKDRKTKNLVKDFCTTLRRRLDNLHISDNKVASRIIDGQFKAKDLEDLVLCPFKNKHYVSPETAPLKNPQDRKNKKGKYRSFSIGVAGAA